VSVRDGSGIKGGTIKMRWPDFSDKRVIDRHLDRLNTHGVSRRDFVSLMSAGAAASAMAASLGWTSGAVAAPSGKIAYMYFSSRLQYCLTVSKAVEHTSEALGIASTSADAELNSQHQLDQYEQLAAAGGLNGVILNAPDGGNLKRIAELAGEQKIWLANVWATLPWFTPFNASEYYTYYADPDDYNASKEITTKLLTEIKTKTGKGGKIIGLTGIPGFITDLLRTRGRDDALKAFPEFRLVDDLPGNFNMEDGNKAAQDLLTRHPDAVGIYAANDEEAAGAIAALKTAGLKAGQDVLIASAGDGNPEAADAIKRGELVATAANVPQFMGAMMTTRLYDVMNGWKPRAPERMMHWGSKMMTKDNVDTYLERYVRNGDVRPFNYRLMSKVLHPKDWDPQDLMTPLDMDIEWAGIAKPQGWEYPKAYVDAKQNGEMAAVAAEYKDHYKIDMFGPSPMKKA
jgi:ABC-type sugar transport system substrate-binding protein